MSYLPDYEPVLVGAHIGLRSWFDEIHPDATGDLKIHLQRNVRTLELLQEVFVSCFDLHVREKEPDFSTMKWEEWKIEELLSIMMPVLELGSLGPSPSPSRCSRSGQPWPSRARPSSCA
eukprot:scaffold1834_cov239-Pinguiococcus_pyrenoidosus.AAC.2